MQLHNFHLLAMIDRNLFIFASKGKINSWLINYDPFRISTHFDTEWILRHFY